MNTTKSKNQFILNCINLNQVQAHQWLAFLEWVNEYTKFNFEINILNLDIDTDNLSNTKSSTEVKFDIDFNQNIVFLFDSKTLTHSLLCQFDTVFLVPKKEPKQINHLLFPLIENVFLDSEHLFLKPWKPICTLITSMFNGDEYKTDFFENTANFKQLGDIENIVCRPGSRGEEHLDLINFGVQNTSLIYVWLAIDPGLYNVWNLGVRLSSAAYCSNANIDDKRGSEHVFELVQALENDKTVDVASTSLRVTDVKNQPWTESENEVVWYQPKAPEIYTVEKLAKFNEQQQKIVSHNIPHCMPVWRTKLHRTNGYFTESRFGPSSDWEFWLRCGTRESKFYLLNQDLGLHYRAPQSYWRRNPKAKNFNDIIVNEYFNGQTRRSKPLSQKLKSLQLNIIVSTFRANDYWAAIGLLYEFILNDSLEINSQKKLLEAVCKTKLGIELECLLDALHKLSPVTKIRDTFPDFLGFYLRNLSETNKSNHLLQQLMLLADKVISSEDQVVGWIIKAKVYQLTNLAEIETACLLQAYQTNRYEFWCNINRIYGLQESLSYFLERLAEAPQISDFSWLTPGCTLYYLPDYSHGNPYQKLLYQNFEQLGVVVKGLSEIDSLNLDLSQFKSGDVLHIHWINTLFNKQTQESIAEVLNNFMSDLILLKRRGVKVVWTVHNRQNHEPLNLDIEYKFRNELSKLCDVVMLHHPLIEMELSSWLNKEANIQIVEHGLYQDTYKNEIASLEARKQIGIDTEKLTIATLGKIKEYKHLVPKLKTFKKAVFEHKLSATYIIAGKIFCKKTLTEIKSFNSESLVVVNKFISDDDVQLYLNSADYVLLSYRDILTSGGLFQAMTFSKYVLAPNLGTLKYYVVDGVNGYKYSSDEELSKILIELQPHRKNVQFTKCLVNWPSL